jgi:hypothetical protein
LLVAVDQLRDVEAMLNPGQNQEPASSPLPAIGPDGTTADTDNDQFEREDEDIFFDSEEGSDY